MGFGKKVINKVSSLWYLLFFGMKGADNVIFGHKDNDGHTLLERHDTGGGVFQDLLEERVTQEVEELRDKNYRVLKEADLYNSGDIGMNIGDDGEITSFTNTMNHLKKKTLSDFMTHTQVYGDGVLVIQDNKHLENPNQSIFDLSLYSYLTTLNVERDGITPRFELEKFVTKIVIRNNTEDNNKKFVDLYVPTHASQFGKIDAMLIANIYNMWENKNYKSDITDFTTFEFISDKAWGAENLNRFRFSQPKLVDIVIFDGNFVMIFDCTTEKYCEYVPEKYKTDSLTNKYEEKAPKGDIYKVDANNFKKKSFLQ